MDEKVRIEKIMLKEGMNSAVFAGEIGIQGSTLSHILNGRNNPSLDVLQKILIRFPKVSSDWLIMGAGSMSGVEKQSQAPTLFDSLDENIIRSNTLESNTVVKNIPTSSFIQQKTTPIQEIPIQAPPETPPPSFLPLIEPTSKSVRKIIVYYTDNTFQEFL